MSDKIIKNIMTEVDNNDLENTSGGASLQIWIQGTCPNCGQVVHSKVNSAGQCSCGIYFYAGFCTMYRVDENNVYIESFLDVERYEV